MELFHGFHVAGVGDDDGKLAQLFKKIWHDSSYGERGAWDRFLRGVLRQQCTSSCLRCAEGGQGLKFALMLREPALSFPCNWRARSISIQETAEFRKWHNPETGTIWGTAKAIFQEDFNTGGTLWQETSFERRTPRLHRRRTAKRYGRLVWCSSRARGRTI